MSGSECNNNILNKQTNLDSVEDLSEYTDADESMSAPTEILAEFLSSIMIKDYDKALKYCELILNYEPNNATAKEFHPLIVEKLEREQNGKDDDTTSASSDSSISTISSSRSISDKSDESDRTTASYSSLEEDEPDFEKEGLAIKEENFCHSNADVANENSNDFLEVLPTSLAEEVSDQNEETTKLKTYDISSPQKLLIRPTPTVTLKQNPSDQVARTRTYTKCFMPLNQNKTENNSKPPLTRNSRNPSKDNVIKNVLPDKKKTFNSSKGKKKNYNKSFNIIN